ncbi:hypothetical protein DFS34DRAFT_596147 [Phlyctochytrium arcticum]|nr:hypothetical protein DFS34DRAFT_596147 [Phlyctochytrium arcticum]
MRFLTGTKTVSTRSGRIVTFLPPQASLCCCTFYSSEVRSEVPTTKPVKAHTDDQPAEDTSRLQSILSGFDKPTSAKEIQQPRNIPSKSDGLAYLKNQFTKPKHDLVSDQRKQRPGRKLQQPTVVQRDLLRFLKADGLTDAPTRGAFSAADLSRAVRSESFKEAWNIYRYLETHGGLGDVPVDVFNQLLKIIRTKPWMRGAKTTKASRVLVGQRVFDEMIRNGVQPNTSSYVSLATSYAAIGHVRKVEEILKAISDRGWSEPDVGPVLVLVAMANDNYRRGFSELKTSSVATSQLAGPFNAVLAGAAKAADDDFVADALRWGKQNAIVPDGGTYDVLIDYFANHKNDIQEAWILLDKRVSSGNGRSTKGYNSILKALVNTGRMRDAQKLFENMETHGIPANSLTYTLMLVAYYKQKDSISAMSLYIAMLAARLHPNRSTNATLAKCFSLWDGPLSELIEAVGGQASPFLYRAVLEGLMEAREWRLALDVIDEYRMQHAHNKMRWPINTTLWNDELDCWAHMGRVHEVESQISRSNYDQSFKPNAHTYKTVIWMYGRLGTKNAEKAEYYFAQMLKDGFVPDVHIYNGLLHSVWQIGEPLNQKAVSYLQDFASRGIDPLLVPEGQPTSWGLRVLGRGDVLRGYDLAKSRAATDLASLPPIEPPQKSRPREIFLNSSKN